MNVLVVDVGGTSVKILATGQESSRSFPSGPTLTPDQMASRVLEIAGEWKYDVVSIGFPAPVINGRPVEDPMNLAPGWVAFDYEEAFDCPVKLMNDAAMQALGSYKGGRMFFMGLGTGLGTALIVEGLCTPWNSLTFLTRKATYEDYLGKRGLERFGSRRWEAICL